MPRWQNGTGRKTGVLSFPTLLTSQTLVGNKMINKRKNKAATSAQVFLFPGFMYGYIKIINSTETKLPTEKKTMIQTGRYRCTTINALDMFEIMLLEKAERSIINGHESPG